MKPAWLVLPPDKWPPPARAFFRLVYIGLERAARTTAALPPNDAACTSAPEAYSARPRS
ncbi:MAG TPA: hypothetical protein VD969_16435 [Symbiobacteriaceae bacterium]|nr:hypothetical protein [Symbiobacteriaceae bacterium]